MVDLMGQYSKIKIEIDRNIISSIESGRFVNGPIVKEFSQNLSNYLNVTNVIPCANGTDALQIAFMALDLKPGDEIICPSWTYIATAEAAAILGIKVVFCDIDIDTFNTTADLIEPHINDKTKAIVPVHLYGQSCNMASIIRLAKKHKLKIIEDNAQAIGCKYTFPNGEIKFTGTLGDVGTTSFYPSKNLGCYGDGGAIFTNDDHLAQKMRGLVNHGMYKRYYHDLVGINSRLDSVQAAILNIKLKNLDKYNQSRRNSAMIYNKLINSSEIIKPIIKYNENSHVFHQYTLRLTNGKRDEMVKFLNENDVPCGVYYPIPLHSQNAYKRDEYKESDFEITNQISNEVFSLPMHSELDEEQQKYIADLVNQFVLKS